MPEDRTGWPQFLTTPESGLSRRAFLRIWFRAVITSILGLLGWRVRQVDASTTPDGYAPAQAYRLYRPGAVNAKGGGNDIFLPMVTTGKDPATDKQPSADKDPISDKDPNEKTSEKDPNEKDPNADKDPTEKTKDYEGSELMSTPSPANPSALDEWGTLG